jgi:LacI family transcriptional regulator
MITMADVARHARVSVSTVSHVLNRTRRVNAETERAVASAVRELGYVHNTIARSLARSRTNSIGVALTAITNIYFSDIVQAIERECAANDHILLLADTHDEPRTELRAVQALHRRRVDGIILAPSFDPDRQALAYLTDHAVPVVLVDRMITTTFDQVGVENKRSTAQLVAHMIGHGHRRIGMISGLTGLSTTIERVAGYRAALRDAGIPFDPNLIRSGESLSAPAHDATQELLRIENPPTALITANNLMTIGALRALADEHRKVPDDIALAGFDDFEWADLLAPRLTTVAQPSRELGVAAARLLFARVAAPDRKPKSIRLRPMLRIRNSCGCVTSPVVADLALDQGVIA